MCNKIEKQKVFAISGIKNSGKTTLIEKIVARLGAEGYKVGVIKHDGHDFEADHEGTDSYRHKAAGATNVIVYSSYKMMMIEDFNQQNQAPSIEALLAYQKEMDVVILEGMKDSNFPKIEVVRQARSHEIVCNPSTLLAIATDTDLVVPGVKSVHLDDLEGIMKIVKDFIEEKTYD